MIIFLLIALAITLVIWLFGVMPIIIILAVMLIGAVWAAIDEMNYEDTE